MTIELLATMALGWALIEVVRRITLEALDEYRARQSTRHIDRYMQARKRIKP
jgi:hypothetical protein